MTLTHLEQGGARKPDGTVDLWFKCPGCNHIYAQHRGSAENRMECRLFQLEPADTSTMCASCKQPWNAHKPGTVEVVWFELLQRVLGRRIPASAKVWLMELYPGLPVYLPVYGADTLQAAAQRVLQFIRTSTASRAYGQGYLIAAPDRTRGACQLALAPSGQICVLKPFETRTQAEAESKALTLVHSVAPGQSCPYLCRPIGIFDAGDNTRPHLVLSYAGPSLASFSKTPAEPPFVQSILLSICCGLATAHVAGRCFGDLKLGNVCCLEHAVLVDGGSITPFGDPVSSTTPAYCLDAVPVACPGFDLVCLATTALHVATGKAPEIKTVQELQQLVSSNNVLLQHPHLPLGVRVLVISREYSQGVKRIIKECLKPGATVSDVLPAVLELPLEGKRPLESTQHALDYLAALCAHLVQDVIALRPLADLVAEYARFELPK